MHKTQNKSMPIITALETKDPNSWIRSCKANWQLRVIFSTLSYLLISCALISCSNTRVFNEHKLTINQSEISKMDLQCFDQTIPLNRHEISFLTEKINHSGDPKLIKGIVNQHLMIYLKNSDTINLRLLGNHFKWNKSGDWAYSLDIDKNYFAELCNKESSLESIKRIFNQYNDNQESTDSKDNLDTLKRSLETLEKVELSDEALTLIINIWMYYTVTDFSTIRYTEKVLFSHQQQSINVLEKRIKNKKEWEREDSAPYSDLKELLEKLKNNR